MARQLVIELVGRADKFTKSLDDADKATKSFGDKIEGAGKRMTAFVSVPIVGFLAASTKAAVDDADAQAHLAQTLSNTVGNSQKLVTQVEDYIIKAQKASTFTDDELRPAFETLVTSTKDVEESQRLLGIAMDVAAGKGIPLEQATNAVARAAEGQFGAVNKLVPGLIDLDDKTLTAEGAVSKLASTFNGQAIGATETTAGKMQNLKRDLGEASEAMGTQLVPAIEKFAGFATDTLLPALDKLTGDNGALVLLGLAAAGPVLTNINKLLGGVNKLNAALGVSNLAAAGALGAVGIIAGGVVTIAKTEGSLGEKIFGPTAVGRAISKAIPGLQSGGPVSGGRPYIVGEKGPELMVPGRSGSIVPNGAGVTVNVAGSVITDRDLGRIVADAMRNNALIGVG